MSILELIGRVNPLFTNDITNHEKELQEIVSKSAFLVVGGAGSIGQAVTKEIFKRNSKKLHVVEFVKKLCVFSNHQLQKWILI